MSEPDHLFVYGTLMSRYHNAHAVTLRGAATFVGPAAFNGRMYIVRGPRGALVYPAVIDSDEPNETVHGELYALQAPRALASLDRYEGAEYARAVRPVRCNGEVVNAFVYLFTGSVDSLRQVLDGRFDA